MIYTNEMIKIEKDKKKKRQNIINNIITIILLILIIVFAYFFYQKFIQKQNPINFFNYHSFVVLTGSMEPTLNAGDLVFSKVNKDNLKVGDIITFFPNNNTSSTTTHRIVNIIEENGKTYFETKGDNNNANDSDLVPLENVVGKMSFKISKLGKIILGLTSSGGIAILLIVFLIRWSINAKRNDIISIREECRKKFNFPKYIRKKFEQGVFDGRK